jgi:hypothetical protein
MNPRARNLLAAFVVLIVIGTWMSIVTSHADAGPTSGAKWALDCRAQIDLYALRHKAATGGSLQSINDFCANTGQQIDDGMAAPDVANEISKWESTTTTLSWGTAYRR